MSDSAHHRLILASTSVYRRDLLQRLRHPFAVVAPAVDETREPGESPEAMARRLARAKALAVAAHHPDAWVIGSDQTASLDGLAVLGKPGSHEAARSQLQAASGRTMTFASGVCLVTPDLPPQDDVIFTRVRFRTLTEAEIERYLRAETPHDCVGAAKSEGLGISLLEAQEGPDPTALIGLPLIRLAAMLRAAGLPLP